MAAPDEAGRHRGLSFVLYRPPVEPAGGGVVILHGAGSRKESHLDFARACRAHGLAAVAFDMRGHGETGGRMDGRIVADVAVIAELLARTGVTRIGLRGSSMGGWLALAAAAEVDAGAVVAICPASGEGLARGLAAGRFAFAADQRALAPLLAATDETAAAAGLGERLLLLHAEGDEQVPVERSRALHAAAPGSRLVAVPGGHHRSVQHDPELRAQSIRFLRRRLSGSGGPPGADA